MSDCNGRAYQIFLRNVYSFDAEGSTLVMGAPTRGTEGQA